MEGEQHMETFVLIIVICMLVFYITIKEKLSTGSPTCRCIIREEEGFVYVSYFDNGLKLIEHWYDKDSSLKNGLYKVLQKMIQEEKRKNI